MEHAHQNLWPEAKQERKQQARRNLRRGQNPLDVIWRSGDVDIQPRWIEDKMVDSRAMTAAYVEYQETCDDAKPKRLRARWKDARWRPPKHLRTMGCEIREPPAHRDCGEHGCTICCTDRRRECFLWASELWIHAYEELRSPTSTDLNQVLVSLEAARGVVV